MRTLEKKKHSFFNCLDDYVKSKRSQEIELNT
jgi:hypothetical protein